MPIHEVLISNSNYDVKADIHVPEDRSSQRGILLAHGLIINRKSLSRSTSSLAGYLCEKLNAYVIAPDYLGETTYHTPRTYDRFVEVLDLSVKYLCTDFDVTEVMGFGHSLGAYLVADLALVNESLSHLVTYGGPTDHILKTRQKGFLNYLMKYLYSFDYKVDLKNLLHLIFDKETFRYLKHVMMEDPEYRGDQYDFYLDSDVLQDMVGILTRYIPNLKEWGKPVLMMLAQYDSLVEKSIKAYPDGHRMDNILVKHVKRASHVTPCMDSLMNMKKLDSILMFHRNVVKAMV